MLITFLLSALSLLLAIICFRAIYKNFMSEHRPIKGIHITIVIALIVVSLYFCMKSAFDIWGLQESLLTLDSPQGLNVQDIESLRQSIPVIRIDIVKQLLVGYAFFLAQFFYMKKIVKDIESRINKDTRNKWTY